MFSKRMGNFLTLCKLRKLYAIGLLEYTFANINHAAALICDRTNLKENDQIFPYQFVWQGYVCLKFKSTPAALLIAVLTQPLLYFEQFCGFFSYLL